jgi:hypothetical protein
MKGKSLFRVFMTLVNAVQEQQQLIKELKKKNADLEKKVLPTKTITNHF